MSITDQVNPDEWQRWYSYFNDDAAARGEAKNMDDERIAWAITGYHTVTGSKNLLVDYNVTYPALIKEARKRPELAPLLVSMKLQGLL